ncbi:hypothetical protein TWF106_000389 [Orbilia oligospora]|uniref:LAA1-like C-terminal TPR repeats domain-containing protein n=1 Tax=Orbilia oligospora TaxID=2813651 RepID=A0A6G1M2L6_ORBOL|nr:hypothetical protein TWF788_008852 [Orbilia oligospora]KAF3197823.1 hypothetical protein TWF679_002606 [Orbilia oligospora]KAF3207410.1 hypothetical protein TWF106_000389 [Orbilia oligospora]KAF3231623.1 hypothetical protein TWF191_005688 [Orbilia oligospora]KAF3240712.1 hypothetical protein TWF192_009388 [Orbilia oligospora]
MASNGGADSTADTDTYRPLQTSTVSLDVNKLQSLPNEQKELYLLSYLADLKRLVLSFDKDGATSHQFFVKKEIFKILNLSSPAPAKVTRDITGVCLAETFGRGDRKLLFESINELNAMISGGGKGDKDVKVRHAAVHCLGEVFRTAGDSALSLSSLSCSSLLKQYKLAQTHAGLRASCFVALSKVVKMLGSSMDETVARDIWKQARSAISSEKSHVVLIGALKCLENCSRETGYFDSSSDVEHIKTAVLRVAEASSTSTRKAAASCLAAALVRAFGTVDEVMAMKAPKKTNKKLKRTSTMPQDEDEIERPETPSQGLSKKSNRLKLTLEDMLRQLSIIYVKHSTNSKVRTTLALTYEDIFLRLGSPIVEANYGRIANHFFTEILSHAGLVLNRFRLLAAKRHVRFLLERVVGEQLLGESGQLAATRYICNDVLKNYPQVIKERPEPTKYALGAALTALTSLIRTLESTVSSLQDIIREGLLQALQHPSYTVQVNAAWCLRSFVTTVPSQLLPIITICMNNVNRELGLLASKRATAESFRKSISFANAMAAIISTTPLQPLYGSIDVTSRILNLATSLLKSSGDSDLRTSSTQIQVAWILIGGLMSLGPNFVKIHLSQLLLLWKNALPKPLAKDSLHDRGLLELSFLAHVRECALGSILCFLQFNARLVTTDVGKRIAAMLQNSSHFLNTLPERKQTDDISQKLTPSLNLLDLDLMVRRRIFQCYIRLVKVAQGEALQGNLMTVVASFFADPDRYTPSSLSTQIQNASGAFDGLWDVSDGYAFGACSLIHGLDVDSYAWEKLGKDSSEVSGYKHWTSRGSVSSQIDRMLNEPVPGGLEHDSVCLYTVPLGDLPNPAPPATEVVNTAIDLFILLLPFQPPKVQESILEQTTNFLASGNLARDPGRKAAITVNVAVALLGVLKLVQMENQQAQISFRQSNVLKIIQDLLNGFLLDSDPFVRNIAAEAIGRLCNIGGNVFTGTQIKHLIDTVVSNRDPNARAGCAVAMGCVQTHVGGMAANLHLKTILGILMSLANDPHPIVHFWSLDGMARTIDAGGLTFSGYVGSTLGMIAQVYVSDTHNEEVGAIVNGNLEDELYTTAVLARCCDSLVGVLGPDLMELTKPRELMLTLLSQFYSDTSVTVKIGALRAYEQFAIYATSALDLKEYTTRLQSLLQSSDLELQEVAIDGLYQLMKSDAQRIVEIADSGLTERLWELIDDRPHYEQVKNLFKNWVAQLTTLTAGDWVTRCQNVMVTMRSRVAVDPDALKSQGGGGIDLGDEEVAGFAAAAQNEDNSNGGNVAGSGQELLRWQVRTFAIECLLDILDILGKQGEAGTATLLRYIADIIKMAFTASTANVIALRIEGLKVINQILKVFGRTPDPDFPEAMLLEQYQAQIASALTPAFAVDSSPELASEALNVCAAFISTGIVQDIDRMGRILKLLTTALEAFSNDTENASIGDLRGLSYNAQVMVKMSLLSAWAELQVASLQQDYLVDVVKPHIVVLAPLWLASLREFARLRFEPDISMNAGGSGSITGSLDVVYSSLNRDVLLKFYQDSWLDLVDAIASLIEQDSEFVFDALDGKSASAPQGHIDKHGINYRDEPVAFFFVLFGIAFEALVGRPGGSEILATKEQILEVLQALKKILHPAVSGHAIYQEAIFTETIDLLDRLVLTEGLAIQLAVVEIARGLCISHPSARQNSNAKGESLSDDINQMFELTRLVTLVIANQLPNLNDHSKTVRGPLSDEAVNVIRASLDALVDTAEVFPAVIRMDLYACILHIFSTVFATGACQIAVVPKALPIFKRFIQLITRKSSVASTTTPEDPTLVIQLRVALSQLTHVAETASRRDTEATMICVRNCLLAFVILIHSGVNMIPANDELLTRVCDAFVDGLRDTITVKTAISCCRSVLMYQPKNGSDMELVKILLPRLLSYVGSDAKEVEGSKNAVMVVINGFVNTLDEGQKQTLLPLLIQTLLRRLALGSKRDPDNIDALQRDTAARLMELISMNQLLFKEILLRLNQEQKQLLEDTLRAGVRAGQEGHRDTEAHAAPKIALKMNF